MVENGYVSQRGRREGQEGAARPSIRARCRPTPCAAGFFAEEVRRELADRYGEKKLYEGGLSVRTTLDPKMQLMARKALTDGLVRYDEAHGWRGAIQRLDLTGRDWGVALAEVPALGDVQPWQLAVVLDVHGDDGPHRPAAPPRGIAAQVLARARRRARSPTDGAKWARKPRAPDPRRPAT